MRKFLFVLLFLFFTLPVFAKNTILIVGDSLSASYGIDPKLSWVKLLQQRLEENNYDYEIINSSISGDTTSGGLTRLPGMLSRYHPKITIIELGGNDGLRGLPLTTIKKNLQNMIRLAEEANSKVLLLAVRLPPNYGSEYVEQFQQIFTDLNEANEIIVIPMFLKGVDDNPNLMQADRIHPTVQAQVIMLNNVWPELEKLIKEKEH